MLVKLKGKKELHRKFKQRQVSWKNIEVLPDYIAVRLGDPGHSWC